MALRVLLVLIVGSFVWAEEGVYDIYRAGAPLGSTTRLRGVVFGVI